MLTKYAKVLVSSVALVWALGSSVPSFAREGIHSAPIVLEGFKIRQATQYPLTSYGLFATAPDGLARPIPFQIDEINEWGDYVLDQGGPVTAKTGNGRFDFRDELAFMGDDVGPAKPPTKWPGAQPSLVYEIKLTYAGLQKSSPDSGAVYLAVFLGAPPPKATKSYVRFSRDQGEVLTSRYRYRFDKQNYLVVRGVDMVVPAPEGKGEPKYVPILDSSSCYMRLDLKYFLTFELTDRTINSELEAYKIGPVRSIVRVSFFYTLMKLNFQLDMFTEVSFFSNAVLLPAIVFNPLDASKSLNRGSSFYYGFAMTDNPGTLDVETNMPSYKPSASVFDFLSSGAKPERMYWVTATSKDRMMHVEIVPSAQMLAKSAIPTLYVEKVAGAELVKRAPQGQAKALGQGGVNVALYFDLTRVDEGEHHVGFRLFFENRYDKEALSSFKSLDRWTISVTPL